MLRIKYNVTKLICGIAFFFVSVNLIAAEQNRRRTVADPVSNFFSELGDLFLDVDREIHVQTAPQVQQEDRIISQIFRPTNEYLNRIQRNYKTIQTRLGKLIGDTLRPSNEHSTSPPKSNYEGHSKVSTAVVPVTARRKTDPPAATNGDQISATEEQSSLTIRENECSSEPLTDPFLEHLRKQRCSRRERLTAEEQIRQTMEKLMQDTRRASELLIPLSSKALDQLSKDLVRRMGEIESEDSRAEESKSEGRIIGDVMYSESRYDKRLREFLKTHGRWLLDNPLLSRWRQSPETPKDFNDLTTGYSTEEYESPTPDTTEEEATETSVPTSTEYEKILSKSGKSFEDSPLPPQSSKYYTIINKDGEVVGEEIDVVIEPQSDYYEDADSQDSEEPEPQDTVILAFTPDGIPLKLRIGPEIDNPIRYLHKALKSAGVSLNIPVESYEDLEPVGKEVLRVGSGILMRAIYIDVSNNNELKSLLKTLMRSKGSGKTKF